MRRGVIMNDVIKTRITADKLDGIVKLPKSFSGKKVEIMVRVVGKESYGKSSVDRLYGCASNLNLSAEEIRAERRSSL